MPQTFRKEIVAFSIVFWLVIGSTARLDLLIGLPIIAFFLVVALFSIAGSLDLKGVIFLTLMLPVSVWYDIQYGLSNTQITLHILEIVCFHMIFSRPGNVSAVSLIRVLILYALISLAWKFLFLGQSFWARENMVFNGPIKFAMICAAGYTLVLFSQVGMLKNPKLKWAILFLFLFAILTSWSRTALAFVVLVTGIYVIFSGSLWKVFSLILCFAAALPILLTTRLAFTGDIDRVGLLEGIAGVRAIAWEDAISLFVEKPIFGPGAFDFQFSPFHELNYPHNIVLDILLNTGIVGLIVFTILLLMSLPRWNGINGAVFATALTSGDIFLWDAVFFAPKRKMTTNNRVPL
jgi:O-antigen ligase